MAGSTNSDCGCPSHFIGRRFASRPGGFSKTTQKAAEGAPRARPPRRTRACRKGNYLERPGAARGRSPFFNDPVRGSVNAGQFSAPFCVRREAPASQAFCGVFLQPSWSRCPARLLRGQSLVKGLRGQRSEVREPHSALGCFRKRPVSRGTASGNQRVPRQAHSQFGLVAPAPNEKAVLRVLCVLRGSIALRLVRRNHVAAQPDDALWI
jgi:hypothetical protein